MTMFAQLPAVDRPDVVFEELIDAITTAITTRPRDLQTRIGPSEIGNECSRELIARLAELPKANEVNWRAWVGTCMHAGLEEIFRPPRWLTETRVTVGTIGGRDITGSCDLFDTETGGVWDWKTKSKTQLQHHRRHGPGAKYRVQAHLYGKGMAAAGHIVRYVGFGFLLRDGDLADAFHWAEPYDPAIALMALDRANQLHALAQLIGPEQAMDLYPRCDDQHCRRCKNYRPPYGAPRAVAASTADLLGGTTTSPAETVGRAPSTRELFAGIQGGNQQ